MAANYLLILSIFAICLFGYLIPCMAVYVLAILLTCRLHRIFDVAIYNVLFIVSMLLLLLFGFYDECFIVQNHSITDIIQWTAFALFPIFIWGNKRPYEFARLFEYLIIILFLLDFFTNILLHFISLPWIDIPEIRPDEDHIRYPGFKNSALFSGYLSLIMFAVTICSKRSFKSITILCCTLINIVFAGSYRFIVILCILTLLRLLNKRMTGVKMALLVISFIVVVVVGTFLTMDVSSSNQMRALLWSNAFGDILNAPISGNGFFVPKVKDETGFAALKMAGVTESTFLSIGINFGIIVMISFIISLFYRMLHIKRFNKYAALLIVQISLYSFGGGIGNILDCTILGLCIMQLTFQQQYNVKLQLYLRKLIGSKIP